MDKQEIRDLFNKIDANGDGHITKEEFVQSAQEQNLGTSPEQIDEFMKKIDTDHDGKLSFEEFNHFIQFNQSQLNEYKFLLDITSSSIGIAKQIEKVIDIKDLNEDHPSEVQILLRDQEAKSIDDMQSSLQIHFGDIESNTHISKILKNKLDLNTAIGFKFTVSDKEKIRKNFEEYIQALKDFLSELGPEISKIVEMVNIQLIDVEDGVVLAIDPESHPFIASYIDVLKKNFEQLQNLKSAFSLMVGTGSNLGDKLLTFEQLINSNFYFELSGRAIRLSNLAQTPHVKRYLQLLNANKDSKGALLAALCVLSFKAVNIELLLNSSDRQQFIQQAEIQNLKDPVYENHLNAANSHLTESGIGDFIGSLDFVLQSINDLKDADCSSVTVFAKVHDIYALVTVKTDIYDVLDELLGLQG